MTSSKQPPQKKIRSYMRRQGRLTQAQQYALDTLWAKYCLDPVLNYDFSAVFGRTAPLFLEIGFGNGDTLAQMAAANPEMDYLGIDVHKPGVGHLMKLLEQQGINNVRIYCFDATEILEHKILDNSLAAVHLFFPDPWPKTKHKKRRIVQPNFVELLSKKLAPGAYFHAATDWQNYAQAMLAVLSEATRLKNLSATNDYCQRPDYRPLTKFEQRGLRLGHGVWDLLYQKL